MLVCTKYILILLRPKKVSDFWSSVSFKIGAVTRFFFGHLLIFNFFNFFLPTWKYTGTKFPMYKVWRPHKSGKKCSYPYVKKSFKAQHGRIPIDPALRRCGLRPETGDFFCTRSMEASRAFFGVSWPSGLVHWTQVLVLSECGFESRQGWSWCFVLRMGRKAEGPVCCVMHVK